MLVSDDSVSSVAMGTKLYASPVLGNIYILTIKLMFGVRISIILYFLPD